MIEVSKLLLLVLGELLLVSLVVSAIVSFSAISKRQRDRAAIRKLIARITDDSKRRGAETRKILEHHFGLSGDGLESVARKIARGEKAFYQVLIDVYLTRNTEALQNICVDYESSVDSYRTLEVSTAVSTDTGVNGTEADSDEVLLLKEENERLTDELRVTMDTMSRMLSEYSLMFSGGAETDLDREKMRELLAPEAVAKETEPPASDAEAVADEEVTAPAEQTETAASETVQEEPEAEESVRDDELQMLDEDLGMLDLSGEAAAESGDQDETVVFNRDQGEKVVDLDEVQDEDPDRPPPES